MRLVTKQFRELFEHCREENDLTNTGDEPHRQAVILRCIRSSTLLCGSYRARGWQMLRRSDLMGFIGFAMMAAGAVLFLTAGEDALALYWLLGTIAWFAGFGVFLGWIFWRVGTFADRPHVFHPSHRKA
jgi:fatty acid desaturase